MHRTSNSPSGSPSRRRRRSPRTSGGTPLRTCTASATSPPWTRRLKKETLIFVTAFLGSSELLKVTVSHLSKCQRSGSCWCALGTVTSVDQANILGHADLTGTGARVDPPQKLWGKCQTFGQLRHLLHSRPKVRSPSLITRIHRTFRGASEEFLRDQTSWRTAQREGDQTGRGPEVFVWTKEHGSGNVTTSGSLGARLDSRCLFRKVLHKRGHTYEARCSFLVPGE